VAVSQAVGRQMEDRGGALDEGVETPIVHASQVAGVRHERRRAEVVEELKHRAGGGRRGSTRVNEGNDGVDHEPRRGLLSEQLSQLGEHDVG
jgi:hypothetical protein